MAESKKTVLAAFAANLGIAVTKFVAAAISGSSAMFAEGVHSVVDTANQGCLLYGMRKAKQPPDETHPFGYGVEMYFWSFIVACLIFGLGAGLSIYEGYHALAHRHHALPQLGPPWISFIVLGIAFCFEGYSWTVAMRQFWSMRKGKGFWTDLAHLKDPSVFVVILEDSAALLGIIVAALGIYLAWATGIEAFDGIASILIGCILAGTAFFMAREVKSLLIGETADADIVNAIEETFASKDEIVTVNEMRTMHLGPNDVLLAMSVDFADDIPSQRIERICTEAEAEIRDRFPIIKQFFLEVQSRKGHDEMVGFDDDDDVGDGASSAHEKRNVADKSEGADKVDDGTGDVAPRDEDADRSTGDAGDDGRAEDQEGRDEAARDGS